MTFTVAVFDSKPYDVESFNSCLSGKGLDKQIDFHFISERLDVDTVEKYCNGCNAICCFVNDNVGEAVVRKLKAQNVDLILARCAGYDMIDLKTCKELGISVARVPAYSPYAVAEFAAALLLTLNRKTYKAYNRVRSGDFTLSGLVGFDIHGKTVGIVGSGKIGRCFADIAIGFGCNILVYDVFESEELKAKPQVKYVQLDELFRRSDIISLHAPLTNDTHHMINARTLSLMKPSTVIINTSRGKLIDSKALLDAILSKKIGGAGLDVYENEQSYFFHDHSDSFIEDPILARFQNMNNVVISSHQAFLTNEALANIADSTVSNALEFMNGKTLDKLTNYVS